MGREYGDSLRRYADGQDNGGEDNPGKDKGDFLSQSPIRMFLQGYGVTPQSGLHRFLFFRR